MLPETVDRLVFDGPQGVMKFEFYRHPRFIKEKTLFAKRLTSNVTVEKIYQTNDVVSVFKAFRKSTHGWEEMKTE